MDAMSMGPGMIHKGLLAAWIDTYGASRLPDGTSLTLRKEDLDTLKHYYESFIDRLPLQTVRQMDSNWYTTQCLFVQIQLQRIVESVFRNSFSAETLHSLFMFLKVIVVFAIQVDASFALEQFTRCTTILQNEHDFNGPTESIFTFMHTVLHSMFTMTSADLITFVDTFRISTNTWSLLDRAIFRLMDSDSLLRVPFVSEQ
jgi:hypothetical protein